MPPLQLHYPFAGRWLVRNSPADRVPSHGTERFGLAYAIDFVPVGYALTQRRRLESGWLAVIGNHVLIEVTGRPGEDPPEGGPAVVALYHLQRGSLTVRVGQQVSPVEVVGRCGNSGNSTDPHLHLHAVNGRDLLHANAVPITFPDGLPRNGEIVSEG